MFVVLRNLFQVNIKLREFHYKPLQFEEELDNLFFGNSVIDENAYASTSDEPIPSEGPTHDDVDHKT